MEFHWLKPKDLYHLVIQFLDLLKVMLVYLHHHQIIILEKVVMEVVKIRMMEMEDAETRTLES